MFVRPFYQLTAVDECRYTSIGMLILMEKNTTESMRASSVKCVESFRAAPTLAPVDLERRQISMLSPRFLLLLRLQLTRD